MHAGELETSVLLAAYPDYVRDGWNTTDHGAADRRYLSTLGISAYTDTGVIGQPSQATKEKGLGALNHLGAAPEHSSACSHRHTTKTCAVAAPVAGAPVRHHGPISPDATNPTEQVLETTHVRTFSTAIK